MNRPQEAALHGPASPPPAIEMRAIAPSGAWSLAGTAVLGVWSLLLVSYLLHTFGSAEFAPWAAGVALVGYLSLLDTGLSATVTRDSAQAIAGDVLARQRVSGAHALFAGLAGVALLIGLAGAAIIPLVLGLSGQTAIDASLVAAILVVDFSIVLATAGWLGILRGSQRFDRIFVVYVVHASIGALLLLPFVGAFGMAGAALAQLVARICSRVLLAALVSRRVAWFSVVPRRVPFHRLRVLWSFSLPIFAFQLATQIGIGSDVLIVGAVAGATAVGLYASGSQLVRSVALLVAPVIGVLLPALSRAALRDRTTPVREVPTLLAMAGTLGAVTFGGLASAAGPVMQLWSGEQPPLGIGVLIAYSAAYVFVTPIQVVQVALIATGRHALIGGVVLVESIVNAGLSIVLAVVVGPIGVAIATLTVVVVDSGFVIPYLSAPRLGHRRRTIYLSMYTGIAVGLVIVLVGSALPLTGSAGLAARVAFYGIALVMALTLIWRSRLFLR